MMVMLRLSEDSTTGSATPLLGTVVVARAAAVAARAICSTAALICSPALAEEGEPSEAAINPKSKERPLVTAWAATVCAWGRGANSNGRWTRLWPRAAGFS